MISLYQNKKRSKSFLDAVASIIGTLKKEESQDPEATSEGVTENETRSNVDAAKVESNDCDNVSKPVDSRKQIYSFDSDEYKLDFDPVSSCVNFVFNFF